MSKQLTGDSGLEVVNDVNFIAALALLQSKKDKTIGLTHVTSHQHGLIWYYNARRQDMYKVLMKDAFNLGIIKGANRRIKQIKKALKPDMPIEEAQKLYKEFLALQAKIDKIRG